MVWLDEVEDKCGLNLGVMSGVLVGKFHCTAPSVECTRMTYDLMRLKVNVD